MKKILIGFIVVNVILLAAVAWLYNQYFTYVDADIHEKKAAQAQVANTFKVAYFDFDTLETYYDFSKQVRNELMQKDSSNEKSLARLMEDYKNTVKEYNKVGASLSQTQQSSYQQRLNEMQVNYQQEQQRLGQDMQTAYITKQQAVKREVQIFLKDYCKTKGYAYVFGTKEYDDFMYYKDTIRNITADLIKGLNDKFRAGKK